MLMYLDVDGLSKVYCLTYNSIIFIIMKNSVHSLSLDGKNNSMIRNHLIFGEDFGHWNSIFLIYSTSYIYILYMLYIYSTIYSTCLFVCTINVKSPNWLDPNSQDPREGLWIAKDENFYLEINVNI